MDWQQSHDVLEERDEMRIIDVVSPLQRMSKEAFMRSFRPSDKRTSRSKGKDDPNILEHYMTAVGVFKNGPQGVFVSVTKTLEHNWVYTVSVENNILRVTRNFAERKDAEEAVWKCLTEELYPDERSFCAS